MIPAWNRVTFHCPICGTKMSLNVKSDDEKTYWGKGDLLCGHQVSATYIPSWGGKLEVVAYHEVIQ